jgi:glutaredoxin
MPQRCHMAIIWGNWLVYVAGFAWLMWSGRYVLAVLWLLLVPLLQWAYVRLFPRISSLLGYGSVQDVPAVASPRTTATVLLYTAAGCPFCPLLEERLRTLQREMGFNLESVDVTFRSGVLTAKGIRTVPVVEVGGRLLTGLATSEQLACFLLGKDAGTRTEESSAARRTA